MTEVPPRLKKRDYQEEREASTTEGITELEEAVDPVLRALLTVDWADPTILQNEEAMKAIGELIDQCHPSLLQRIIDLIDYRIRHDLDLFFQQESNLKVLREFRGIGDMIYVKRRRRHV